MAIRSFKWEGLKKVSARELALTDALFEFLPATGIREHVALAVRKTLIGHLGQDVKYFLDSVSEASFADFSKDLSEPAVIIVFGMKPVEQKGFIHIDGHLARVIIDRLLGGRGESVGEVSELTETEQGVLQYLIMQLMAEVYKLCGSSPRVHFRFERFAFHGKDLVNFVSPKDTMAVLNWRVSCFGKSGFVRLVFPDPFVSQAFLSPEVIDAKKMPAEMAHFKRQLERFGFIKTTIWAEGGRVTLSGEEIDDLEPGDVLLLDETLASMQDDELTGEVLIRAGQGEKSSVRAKIKRSIKKLELEIEGN